MDISALQARMRSFAAARDWQSRHTPKNLAMALTVESAGLLEMFQWTTLSESRGVVRDPAYKERVAHGVADVLLCLLQLADQAGVDLAEAVECTLRAKAIEHPPKHPELEPPMLEAAAARMAAPAVPEVHVLVDWENVQPKGDELKALEPHGTDVWLFHGPHQPVDSTGHEHIYGVEQVTRVPRTGTGKNALDFQLAYYAGYLSARQPTGKVVVVSNDRGYDPMLEHARQLGFDARRYGFHRAQTPPAVPPAPTEQKSAPLPPPAPSPAVSPAAETAVKATAKAAAPQPTPAKAASARIQATRADMQQLIAQLDGLPIAHRPVQKDALLVLLQSWLGEPSARSPRTLHALAQLQARQRVVVKGEEVSYRSVAVAPPTVKKSVPKATPSKAVASKAAPAQKASGPTAPPKKPPAKKAAVSSPPKSPSPTVGKIAAMTAQSPTAAQVARAVLASFQKMTNNKPRQRPGLLKHIEALAAKTEDPAAMAQRVLSLLEARKDVVIAADGKGITYSEKK